MSHRRPARTSIRRARLAGLLLVAAAIAAAVGDPWPGFSPSPASSSWTAPSPVDAPRREQRRERAVPDAAIPFDVEDPAAANLDPALLDALREAAADAMVDGVELDLVSGWRSPQHQERLLREAVAKYGSREEAARWVATPEKSAHVSGDAVDIGPPEAAAWVSEHGAEYGLCRIYGNEPWHFELRPDAAEHGCPATYPDPAHDPRMQP